MRILLFALAHNLMRMLALAPELELVGHRDRYVQRAESGDLKGAPGVKMTKKGRQ